MKVLPLIVMVITTNLSINAQGIVGKWKTIDDETGQEKSIVEIYKKGEHYFGKVVDILEASKKSNKCKNCTDYRKDQPIVGMEIIKDLKQKNKEFINGNILDPNNGKIYDCKIWLKDKNILYVRGYVMFFFRTQEWIRMD